jgi:hypothetical protein
MRLLRFAACGLLLLVGCTSAAAPGAGNVLDQVDKAYVAQAQSDLRNASVAEDAYFAQNGTYSTDLNALGVHPSSGMNMMVAQADASGYCIQAQHETSMWHYSKATGSTETGPC